MALGTGIQFFYLNGTKSTVLTGVVGTSGYISAMAWDTSSHLYALNGISGKLHVYTVSSKGAVETEGSPYQPSFCGLSSGGTYPMCNQVLVVQSK